VKQLVVLSGKGGTGKTSLVAAFAHLAATGVASDRGLLARRLVLVDADVDASNLELVLRPTQLEAHDFVAGELAVVDEARCDACGACAEVCRFDAITLPDPPGVSCATVDPFGCEGCAACVYACPVEAIRMEPQMVGQWFRSQTPYGPLFHAALHPGQENSGKMVTMVRQQARLLAVDEEYPLVVVDGPPGIGCPVISAAAGADLVLLVSEPSVAGIHDMERAWRVAEHFHLPSLVCINKADVYPPGTTTIKRFCHERQIELAGSVPYDLAVIHAMRAGTPVTLMGGTPSAIAMVGVWERVLNRLEALP
jgi:MinD superfamily P-loop ATPase